MTTMPISPDFLVFTKSAFEHIKTKGYDKNDFRRVFRNPSTVDAGRGNRLIVKGEGFGLIVAQAKWRGGLGYKVVAVFRD